MKDRIYFIGPTTHRPGWRVRTVVEHGPYHERRPATWRGPFPTARRAQLAAWELEAAYKARKKAAAATIPDLGFGEGSWIISDARTGTRNAELFTRMQAEAAAGMGFRVETSGQYRARIQAEEAQP